MEGEKLEKNITPAERKEQKSDPEKYEHIYKDIFDFFSIENLSPENKVSKAGSQTLRQEAEKYLLKITREKAIIREGLQSEESFEKMLWNLSFLAWIPSVARHEARKFFCGIIADSMPTFEKLINSDGREHNKIAALEAIQEMIAISREEVAHENGSDIDDILRWIDFGDNFIIENFPAIESLIKSLMEGQIAKIERATQALDYHENVVDLLSDRSVSLLARFIDYSYGKEVVRGALELLVRAFSKELPSASYALRMLINKRQADGVPIGSTQKVIKKIVEFYGLDDPDSLLKIWLQTAYSEEDSRLFLHNYLLANLWAIRSIEKSSPGAARALQKEFGIKDFGRYPEEMLLSQYEERDDIEKPYGIILYPQDDNTGAFYGGRRVFANLYSALKDTHSLRTVEAGSKIEIGRRLIELDRRYGKRHKISFAIIGGHGTINSIKFGDGSKRSYLFSDDLRGRGVKRSKKFFEDDATLILVSCNTGQPTGIAEKLSKVFGFNVIAPDMPSNIGNIWVKKSADNKLSFKVEYTEGVDTKSYFQKNTQ
ncbi:MAG: hypothetical protein HYT12_02745 [Candidatus Liptonbacteria bacterium]|nr:hypothetical protein [Candidatus Liptonbacteria bacterium]